MRHEDGPYPTPNARRTRLHSRAARGFRVFNVGGKLGEAEPATVPSRLRHAFVKLRRLAIS